MIGLQLGLLFCIDEPKFFYFLWPIIILECTSVKPQRDLATEVGGMINYIWFSVCVACLIWLGATF